MPEAEEVEGDGASVVVIGACVVVVVVSSLHVPAIARVPINVPLTTGSRTHLLKASSHVFALSAQPKHSRTPLLKRRGPVSAKPGIGVLKPSLTPFAHASKIMESKSLRNSANN